MLKELTSFSLAAAGSSSFDLPPIPGFIEALVLDVDVLVTNTDALNPHTLAIKTMKRQFEFDLQLPEGMGYYGQALDFEDLQVNRFLQCGVWGPAAGTNNWRVDQSVAGGAAIHLTDQIVIPIADPRASDPRDFALESDDLMGTLYWRAGADQVNFTAVATVRVTAIFSHVSKRGSHLGLLRRVHSISYTDLVKGTILDGHISDVAIVSTAADFTGHGLFTWQQDGTEIIPAVNPARLTAEEFMQGGWGLKDFVLDAIAIKQMGPAYSTQSVRKHRYGLKWSSLPASVQKLIAIEVLPNTPEHIAQRRPWIRQVSRDDFPLVVSPKARNPLALALSPSKMQQASSSLLAYSVGEPDKIVKMGKLLKKSEGEIKSALQHSRG